MTIKRISVRNLVTFILRSGNIDSRFTGRNRLEEGAAVHRKLQKAENYQSEVHLSITEAHAGVSFTVEGRADGVIITDSGVTIDEIKSTLTPLSEISEDFSMINWAQAMCYGYMYGMKNDLHDIDIRLTYYEMDSGAIKRFVRTYLISELASFFAGLLEKYAVWVHFEKNWKEITTASMQALEFPFETYREGQRKLAAAVYKTIIAHGRLFAMAPTGIGKTISTIFPALKAMGEGRGEKIFYLTAKTITGQAAGAALSLLRKNGLCIKSVTITAKDKICPLEERICKPTHCVYAQGHFDRINDAVMDGLHSCDDFTAEVVQDIAERHKVCPYELSLELTLWSDVIICDYNYVFDPQVYLRRFFSEQGDYIFLIDEAHNMADRAREMYSASISKRSLLKAKQLITQSSKSSVDLFTDAPCEALALSEMVSASQSPDLLTMTTRKRKGNASTPCVKTLTKLNKLLIEMRSACEETGFLVEKAKPETLGNTLEIFAYEFSAWLTENFDPDPELLQVYFDVLSYLNIAELYDERFRMLYETGGQGELRVKQFCADPSDLLKKRFESGSAAILFSATLMPLRYFSDVLGGGEDCKHLALPSPFPHKNMLLMIADHISTKYTRRDHSYEQIADLIYQTAHMKNGNYMVYFPSYKYLAEVYAVFCEKYPEINAMRQMQGMAESERYGFLTLFDYRDETMIAFCVLGGVFSEGIDLAGDRLIGVIVVGVGLPQLNLELDTVRAHYEQSGCGFDFAYRFPGMNKVLQAAGRVIRSDADKGVVLLIDERLTTRQYAQLFPEHWQHWRVVRTAEDLEEALEIFWDNV
ncbi:MAG: ATP-dependent DNA helicase [Oscillospiraceae bacterium]|nr:ATP-dependent DNA helicase [Oscillospiraceae bacterium]